MKPGDILLSQNLAAPTCYAVGYRWPNGYGGQGWEFFYPGPGHVLEEPAVDEAIRGAAEAHAAELRGRGFRDVTVSPRYYTPAVGLN